MPTSVFAWMGLLLTFEPEPTTSTTTEVVETSDAATPKAEAGPESPPAATPEAAPEAAAAPGSEAAPGTEAAPEAEVAPEAAAAPGSEAAPGTASKVTAGTAEPPLEVPPEIDALGDGTVRQGDALPSSEGGTTQASSAADPWGHPTHPAAGQLMDPFRRSRPVFLGSSAKPVAPAQARPLSPAFEPLPSYEPPRYEPRRSGSIHPRISGYGGISLRSSSVSRKLGLLSGTRGGLILGRWMVGGAFYRLQHRFARPIAGPEGSELDLHLAYGGVTVGVHAVRGRIVDLGLGALLGGGLACVGTGDADRWRCIDQVKMFVVEPEVTLYLNLARWMRVRLAAGYRLARRGNWQPPNDFTMSGGYGELGLEFGFFRRK